MKAAILLAAALSFVAGAGAAGQPQPKRGPFCAERGALVAQLRAEYQQEPTALGQMGPKRLLEIFIARNGDWTVLITEASGVSCIVAAGDNWDSRNLIFAQGA